MDVRHLGRDSPPHNGCTLQTYSILQREWHRRLVRASISSDTLGNCDLLHRGQMIEWGLDYDFRVSLAYLKEHSEPWNMCRE